MYNKKGFVLLETITVLIVTVISMLGLFLTYSFVFKNLKQDKFYDNINDIYRLNVFYKSFIEHETLPSTSNSNYVFIDNNNCAEYFDSNCLDLLSKLEFNKIIYTTSSIDDILSNPIGLDNTDINYIKKLDKKYMYLIGIHQKENEKYYSSLKVGEFE